MSKLNSENLTASISSYVLNKQEDGIFSTDGTLNVDPLTQSVTYVYYYCNQFIKLDSNLNLIYTSHTIDTTLYTKLKLATLSNGSQTLAQPPGIINKSSAVNSKWLFVNSLLRASNEVKQEAENNAVVDVYSLADGKYHFSFYLPDYNNTHLTRMYVSDNSLLAFYGSYVTLYSMKF